MKPKITKGVFSIPQPERMGDVEALPGITNDEMDTLCDHPLHKVLMAAIHQAAFGKGIRHGGAAIPFMEQPWHHYAKLHGRGFLTGQAAKKLEEAATRCTGEDFRKEVLGAIVYAGAAILYEDTISGGGLFEPIQMKEK